MPYFRLFPDVLHRSGASGRGMVYALPQGRMYSLEKRANRLVEEVEQNRTLSEVALSLGIDQEDLREMLVRLESLGLGYFSDLPLFVEKLRRRNPLKDLTLFVSRPELDYLQINLTHRCGQNCGFCEASTAADRFRPCLGCRRGSSGGTLSIEQIDKCLEESSWLEYPAIRLAANDPALIGELLLRTVERAAGLEFGTIACFFGSPPSRDLLEELVRYRIGATFQLFSREADIHDRICGRAGSFERTIESTQRLKDLGMPFSLYYLYTGEGDPVSDLEGIRALAPANVLYDRIMDASSGPSAFLSGASLLRPPDIGSYVRSLEAHHCQHGALTLDADGGYHFCPCAFEGQVGHVDTSSVQDILELETKRRKECADVPLPSPCSACEYALACGLCKAGIQAGLPSSRYCGIDPYRE